MLPLEMPMVPPAPLPLLQQLVTWFQLTMQVVIKLRVLAKWEQVPSTLSFSVLVCEYTLWRTLRRYFEYWFTLTLDASYHWTTTLVLGVGKTLTLQGVCGDVFVLQAT